MAAKIGKPRQTTGSPASSSGETSRNSRVNEGTLIAAPDSGSTVRSPNCAVTTPAPRRWPKRRQTGWLRSWVFFGVRLAAGLLGADCRLSKRRLANPLGRFSTPARISFVVMPGLDPGIHPLQESWIAGVQFEDVLRTLARQ